MQISAQHIKLNAIFILSCEEFTSALQTRSNQKRDYSQMNLDNLTDVLSFSLLLFFLLNSWMVDYAKLDNWGFFSTRRSSNILVAKLSFWNLISNYNAQQGGGGKKHRWKEEEKQNRADLIRLSQNICAVSLSISQFSSETGSSGTRSSERELLEKNLELFSSL